MSQNLLSAAVVIGALRVKFDLALCLQKWKEDKYPFHYGHVHDI